MRTAHKLALIAVGSAAVAGTTVWAILSYADRPKKKPELPKPGRVLCPADVGRDPPAAVSVGRGDFVAVALQSGDGSFVETTWASVLAGAGPDIVVALTGEQVAEGVKPLSTERHGFSLGTRLLISRECVWEVFRPSEIEGQILCGPQVTELATFLGDDADGMAVVPAGLIVNAGDRVEIVVASKEALGTAWFERLWTRVVTMSRSGQVLTAMVVEQPEKTDNHGLSMGSVVRFNRDCVIGVA